MCAEYMYVHVCIIQPCTFMYTHIVDVNTHIQAAQVCGFVCVCVCVCVYVCVCLCVCVCIVYVCTYMIYVICACKYTQAAGTEIGLDGGAAHPGHESVKGDWHRRAVIQADSLNRVTYRTLHTRTLLLKRLGHTRYNHVGTYSV